MGRLVVRQHKSNITYGHSKDHRPDLKQFMIKMLCVGRNIPILGRCIDGNASDKTVNNDLLSRTSKHMAKHQLSPGAFLYVADAAMVTENNLRAIDENVFVTRLPFSYNEASRVVAESVAEDCWEQVGTLNDTPSTNKRPPAHYRLAEKSVTLYGQQYRAVVVHSSAHDKHRLKRIDREIEKSATTLSKLLADETTREYFCRADADQAALRVSEFVTQLHYIETSVCKKVRYARGRPKKNQSRNIASKYYVLDAKVQPNLEHIKQKKHAAPPHL